MHILACATADVAGSNPAISEHVIMPCLTMLLHTIGAAPLPTATSAVAAVATSSTGTTSASDARTPTAALSPTQPGSTSAIPSFSGGSGRKFLLQTCHVNTCWVQ